MNGPRSSLKTQNKSDVSFVCQFFQYFEPEIISLMDYSLINCYFIFGGGEGGSRMVTNSVLSVCQRC